MTFRTFDIDNNDLGSAIPNHSDASGVARNIRSRRHAAMMSRRTSGARIRGFGI